MENVWFFLFAIREFINLIGIYPFIIFFFFLTNMSI